MAHLARNDAPAGDKVRRLHVRRLPHATCGLAVLAVLGAASCAEVDRKSCEMEEPLKFDLQYEVAQNGEVQCVLTIENCGTRSILVSRHVFVSAKSRVLYPPGSRGFAESVVAGTGHPFDFEHFVYLFPRDEDDLGSPAISVKFTLGREMLLEHDEYPAVLEVHGVVFVVALKGATNWYMQQYENRSWEGTFVAHHVPFRVQVPLPKSARTK